MTACGQEGHKSHICMISWVESLPLFIWIKLLVSQLQIPGLAWRMKSCNTSGQPFQGLVEGGFPKERVCVGKRPLASLPQRHAFFMVPHVLVFALGQLPAHHSICRWLAQGEYSGSNQPWHCLGRVSNKKSPSYDCMLIRVCEVTEGSLLDSC